MRSGSNFCGRTSPHGLSSIERLTMISKLIPTVAILAALGSAHAESNLNFYGLGDLSYGKNELVDSKKSSFHSGGDNGSGGGGSQGNSTSRIGLKGDVDIGNGLKAMFTLESAEIDRDLRIGKQSKALFNRQAWVGLSGGFGEARFGRQDSVPFQTMVGYDFNGAANAATALGNATVAPWLRGRQTQSLQYISPSFGGGLKAQVGFAAKEDGVDDSKSSTSAALTYTAGKFAASVTGETKRENAGFHDSSFTAVAGSYDFDIVKIMAGYADGGTDRRGTSLGIVAPVAGFNIGMMYGKNRDTKDAATEFFVNREIFKNTYAYLDYGHVDFNDTSGKKAYAVGLIYVFDLKIF